MSGEKETHFERNVKEEEEEEVVWGICGIVSTILRTVVVAKTEGGIPFLVERKDISPVLPLLLPSYKKGRRVKRTTEGKEEEVHEEILPKKIL